MTGAVAGAAARIRATASGGTSVGSVAAGSAGCTFGAATGPVGTSRGFCSVAVQPAKAIVRAIDPNARMATQGRDMTRLLYW